MLSLVAIKSHGHVTEGEKYQIGGVIQNRNQVVLMQDKNIIPGYYDCNDVFGISKEEITKKITQREG